PLAQNGLELTKVFEFKTPEVPPSFMDRQKNFVRRLSSAGASYYNVYGT
ncbi:unnamed protein product, partial [Adineta steineri]